ncbi:MAG: response regulator, partial [Hyphomicrobium sp.]
VLDKLFQPFSQAETSISRRFGGTGLGLAIARHLAGMMGGTIRLDSELGKGTTAIVELPLVHGSVTASDMQSDQSVLNGARVIVIDDRESNREIVTNYLQDCSANVVTVASTAEAWPILVSANDAQKPFHAAIVDMVMPDENGLEFARRIKADPALARLKIIIATSLNWQGDITAIREAGIEAVLTKPIRRDDLVDAAARAVTGTRHPGWRSDRKMAARFEKGVPDRPVRQDIAANVLLAEDNPVNVEVAKEYLSGFGCTVSVVNNGLEAISALKSATFDVVLMDCQMPIMDGLTATRRIRILEKQRGGASVPVIALTANAFAEDRQRCFDSGMDDYISKPYSEDQLYAALEKWVLRGQKKLEHSNSFAAENVTAADGTAASNTLDEAVLAPLRSKRPELLARIIKTFLTYAPAMLTELTSAAASGDLQQLARSAHSLKSSSANLGAATLAARCRDLEKSAEAGNLDESKAHALAIAAGFAAAERALKGELTALEDTGEPVKVVN